MTSFGQRLMSLGWAAMYPEPPCQTGSTSDERKQRRRIFPVETGQGEDRGGGWRGGKEQIIGEGSCREVLQRRG